MADIFVSYRRGDSAGHTGRLVDSLVRHFGRPAVFQDVQSIEAGRRWDEVIREGVSRCRVLVAVIGQDWLAAGPDGQRRIDDPRDHLRREVATALERNIPVIPVLVDGARMPAEDQLPDELKPIVQWQAHELSDSRWEYDVGRLVTMMAGAGGIATTDSPPVQPPSPARRWSMAGAMVVLVVTGGLWLTLRSGPLTEENTLANERPAMTTRADVGDETRQAVTMAPTRFEGDWYDEDATHWSIRVTADDVEINHTALGTGTAIGYAEGKIRDRTVHFQYVVLVPDEPRLNGQLVISDDENRLTGVLTDLEHGGSTRVVLYRERP